MTDLLNDIQISWAGWLIAFLASFILGVAKGGIKGLGAIIATMVALIFGSKASTGILMPLLMAGDVFAVAYYRRHAEWKYLFKLMPWVIIGILAGVWYGKDLPEHLFRQGMAILILVSVALMILAERKRNYKVPDNKFFAALMGGSAGFATMVGNLAGPFSDLYFLAIRVPKEIFIGTAAWLFFLTNLIKLPFHVWTWKTIHLQSLLIDLVLLPGLMLGLWAGVLMVKVLRQDQFRHLIIFLTAVGALLILIRD